MRTEVNENNSIFDIIIFTLIAGSGGAASYLQKYLESGTFRLGFFCAQVGVSAFSGGLLGHLAGRIFPDYAYSCAGIGGLFGLQVFYLLINLWLKFIGKQYGVETEGLKITKEMVKRKRSEK